MKNYNKYYSKDGILKGQNGLGKSIVTSRFPIMEQYQFNVYPDKNVSKSGFADIETFAGNDWDKDKIHYPNGFILKNKYPGQTSIVYNPNKITEQDIALEGLHIAREQDPIYKDLVTKYENEAKNVQYDDFHQSDNFENDIDGVLRGSLYQGNRVKAKYAPAEEYIALYKNNLKLKQAFDNLKSYINSGYIQPSIIKAWKE